MKKRLLIISTVLTVFCFTAFAYVNLSNAPSTQKEPSSNKRVVLYQGLKGILKNSASVDLLYNVSSRFMTTITKENLQKATSAVDIVPKEAEWSQVSFKSMKVAILQGEDEIKAYYLTVVPEKEAEYVAGYDALIAYLKENSIGETAIITQDKLRPCRINFTVTKTGAIANVSLDSTSGYPSVDEALVKLVSNMPGKWNPASNAEGEKVEQELVFFFGVQGC